MMQGIGTGRLSDIVIHNDLYCSIIVLGRCCLPADWEMPISSALTQR